MLDSADDSPVPGLKLTAINDDTTYLLYAGYWFPVTAYGIDRFSATMNVTVPAHMMVIGSGSETVRGTFRLEERRIDGQRARARHSPLSTGTRRVFRERSWREISGLSSTEAGIDLHVYFKPLHKDLAAAYAETAVKEFTYFITLYGPPASNVLRVVELPDDTVPSAWAPEIAARRRAGVTERMNYRLLANAIAHQWWGVSVSPAIARRLVVAGWLRQVFGSSIRGKRGRVERDCKKW